LPSPGSGIVSVEESAVISVGIEDVIEVDAA